MSLCLFSRPCEVSVLHSTRWAWHRKLPVIPRLGGARYHTSIEPARPLSFLDSSLSSPPPEVLPAACVLVPLYSSCQPHSQTIVTALDPHQYCRCPQRRRVRRATRAGTASAGAVGRLTALNCCATSARMNLVAAYSAAATAASCAALASSGARALAAATARGSWLTVSNQLGSRC